MADHKSTEESASKLSTTDFPEGFSSQGTSHAPWTMNVRHLFHEDNVDWISHCLNFHLLRSARKWAMSEIVETKRHACSSQHFMRLSGMFKTKIANDRTPVWRGNRRKLHWAWWAWQRRPGHHFFVWQDTASMHIMMIWRAVIRNLSAKFLGRKFVGVGGGWGVSEILWRLQILQAKSESSIKLVSIVQLSKNYPLPLSSQCSSSRNRRTWVLKAAKQAPDFQQGTGALYSIVVFHDASTNMPRLILVKPHCAQKSRLGKYSN